MFHRTWTPQQEILRKSVLLLGPRLTGKSTLLRAAFPKAANINLLDSRILRQLSASPEDLYDIATSSKSKVVIVDEVQKVPELLNEVQRALFERPELVFVLTGSSARKLRKHGTNLLGGRLSMQLLCPLTIDEARSHPDTQFGYRDLIAWGGLPSVLLSPDPGRELEDYVGVYLKEEIQAEALIRNLGQFTRFLNVAALSVGQQILFSRVGNDCQVPATTVRDYFQLLEDTLVGHLLPAFQETKKRKAYASAKFYFFDLGVTNLLRGTLGVARGDASYGAAFEQLVYGELRAWQAYQGRGSELYYWRSLSNFEVDFVVRLPGGRLVGIEAKATSRVSSSDTRGLVALAEDVPNLIKAIVCEEAISRTTDRGVDIIPVKEFSTWLTEINASAGKRLQRPGKTRGRA